MGMFKQLKDMKQMVEAAPGMVQQAQEMGAQAQQMGAQAQQMAAAQQAAAQAQMAQMTGAAGGPPTGPDFEPIAGVTLEQYTTIAKALVAVHNDQAQVPGVVSSHGVSPADWETASPAWASRIQANPAVGLRFNQLYRAS
jgi:hypothetical protein